MERMREHIRNVEAKDGRNVEINKMKDGRSERKNKVKKGEEGKTEETDKTKRIYFLVWTKKQFFCFAGKNYPF